MLNPSTVTGLICLVWSLSCALIVGALRYFSEVKESKVRVQAATIKGALRTAAFAFTFNYLALAGMFYFNAPPLVGYLGGLLPLVLCALATISITSGLNRWRHGDDDRYGSAIDGTPSFFGALGLIVLVLIVCLVQSAYYSWGSANCSRYARVPHIRIAGAGETLPATDPKHLVLVSQDIAAFKGQQVMGGGNLGSTFELDKEDYTLQSIQKHLYWIAPLEYHSIWNQLGGSLNYSPGYVAVDAENPDAIAVLHGNYKIRYMPNAVLGRNLFRHVYLSGYIHGSLEDATIEVDDNWRPFYTVTYTVPSNTVGGTTIKKILVVDAQTGSINAYDPKARPSWVDRVISEDVAMQWVEDWGKWHSNNSWPNLGSAGQMKPDSCQLVYNTEDKPVYLMPMTSFSDTDKSSTGLVLFDTQDNSGVFYPSFNSKAIGDNVTAAFASCATNMPLKYTPTTPQLYQIDGNATWLAIYESGTSMGNQYQAVGLLDANAVDGKNVQMYKSLDQALNAYANYLATRASGNNNISQSATQKTLVGKVLRYGSDLSAPGTMLIIVSGSGHIFSATTQSSASLTLIEKGDQVTISYVETGQKQVPVKQIVDTTLDKQTEANR